MKDERNIIIIIIIIIIVIIIINYIPFNYICISLTQFVQYCIAIGSTMYINGNTVGADPGFFQRGGCNFENPRQTSQSQGNGGWERVGRGRVGRVRVRVMFEYADFLHFDFRGI